MKKLIISSLGLGLFKFEITEPNPLEPTISVNILHTFFNFGKVDFIFHNESLKVEHPEILEEFNFSDITLIGMYGEPKISDSLEKVVLFLKERGFNCCFPIVEEVPESLPIKLSGYLNDEGQASYFTEPMDILVNGIVSYEFPTPGSHITSVDSIDITSEQRHFIFLNQNGIGGEVQFLLNSQSIIITENVF